MEREARAIKEGMLYVCTGSHCRKAWARDARLERSLARLRTPVTYVRCQKVCKGPVVGVSVAGELHWFRKMDSRKAWKALAGLIEAGTLARPLEKRRDRARAGKLRS